MYNLCKPASATWKLFLQFLNHVLNWMFQFQDVISSKPGFALAEGKRLNLIRILSLRPKKGKKRLRRRFTYLDVKLSFKLVYYCVFFSCESNLINF